MCFSPLPIWLEIVKKKSIIHEKNYHVFKLASYYANIPHRAPNYIWYLLSGGISLTDKLQIASHTELVGEMKMSASETFFNLSHLLTSLRLPHSSESSITCCTVRWSNGRARTYIKIVNCEKNTQLFRERAETICTEQTFSLVACAKRQSFLIASQPGPWIIHLISSSSTHKFTSFGHDFFSLLLNCK